MTEYERVREQTLLTDEEIEQAFHDAPLEDYKVGDSLRNIAQAQLDKALKTNGIEIRADDQSLPENPFEQAIEKEGLPEDRASRERLLNNSALYKQAQEQIANLDWVKCRRKNEVNNDRRI